MTVASQVKQTLATLKGARGTLSMYTAQTRDDETQLIYTFSVFLTILPNGPGRVPSFL